MKVLQLYDHDFYQTYNEQEKQFYNLNIISENQTYGQEAIPETVLNNTFNFAKSYNDINFFMYKLLHTTSLEQEGNVSLH